jgi:hypothetical protein
MSYLRPAAPAALLTVLLALFGVSSASAALFHSSAGAGIALTGEQAVSHKMTVTGSSITCTTAKFTGTTTAATAETLKLHPEYSGCTAFGFVGATINSTGCQYLYNANSEKVTLEGCTSGAIVVTASSAFGKCVLEIPNQAGIAHVKFTKPGFPILLKISITKSNTKMKVTTSTGICPVSVGEHSNGVYTGEENIKPAAGEYWWE